MRNIFFTNDTEWYASDLRRVFEMFNEGVIDDSLEVTAGGTGISVDVAEGFAVVQGDDTLMDGTSQGKYLVEVETALNSEAFLLGGLQPVDDTDPRIDQIVARVYDDEVDSSGETTFRLEVVTGTPTSGADLSNHDGAATLPDSTLRLAYVLVGAGVTEITTPDIEDVRTNAEPTAVIGDHGTEHELGGADPIPSLPTPDQKDAMDGANGPDSTNVFATMTDVGGGGGGGTLTLHDEIPTDITDVDEITFSGAEIEEISPGHAGVYIDTGGGGGGFVPERTSTIRTTASLADGATEDWTDATFPSLCGVTLIKISTDVAARVRVYTDATSQTADAARAFGTDPTGDHGVLMDFRTTAMALDWRINPCVDCVKDDKTTDNTWCISITNDSGSTDTVQLELTYIPLEFIN